MEAFGFEQAQKEYTLQSFGKYIFILIYFFLPSYKKKGLLNQRKAKKIVQHWHRIMSIIVNQKKSSF